MRHELKLVARRIADIRCGAQRSIFGSLRMRSGSAIFGERTGGSNEDGINTERLAVPFDSQKLVQLFGYIARGLVVHHWGSIIPSGHMMGAVLLNPVYEPHFQKLFLGRANAWVNGNVGDGAFLHQGAQGIDDPALTMWRFQAFGGIVMAGDEELPGAGDYTVWVPTARHIAPVE